MYVIVLAFLGCLVLLCLLWKLRKNEHFMEFTRLRCPTRNMSYDLRGEAYYPKRDENVWLNSEIGVLQPDACLTPR